MCEGGNFEIICPIAEGRTVVRVVIDGTGRLDTEALVVLSERFGRIESDEVSVVVVWLILLGVVVCVSSKDWTPGDQYA